MVTENDVIDIIQKIDKEKNKKKIEEEIQTLRKFYHEDSKLVREMIIKKIDIQKQYPNATKKLLDRICKVCD